MRATPSVAGLVTVLGLALLIGPVPTKGQPVPPATGAPQATLSRADIERFLLTARIVRTRGAPKGITGTTRATLSDGTLTHDASIQTLDEVLREFQTPKGVEFNLRDSWRHNVVAYRLDVLLDLGMVPVSVQRAYRGQDASFTWWVDDVLMDEEERFKSGQDPPDKQDWAEQMWIVRVFDQLIYNLDRNLGNLLITRDWQIWMIDHGRAFRPHRSLQNVSNIPRCDRRLLERLRALDQDAVQRALGDYLGRVEIEALLARRDLIAQHVTKRGEAALYESKRLK
jgi:hypothetical protein